MDASPPAEKDILLVTIGALGVESDFRIQLNMFSNHHEKIITLFDETEVMI